MARPRTTKTTYPGPLVQRTRYVTTYANGNRRVTNVRVNNVFVYAGWWLLGMGVALLGMLIVAVLVILGVVALIGLAARSTAMKNAPKAWLGLWGGLIGGWFARLR